MLRCCGEPPRNCDRFRDCGVIRQFVLPGFADLAARGEVRFPELEQVDSNVGIFQNCLVALVEKRRQLRHCVSGRFEIFNWIQGDKSVRLNRDCLVELGNKRKGYLQNVPGLQFVASLLEPKAAGLVRPLDQRGDGDVIDGRSDLFKRFGFSAEASATSLSWLIFNDLRSSDSPLFGSAAATSVLTIVCIVILLTPVLIRTWRDFSRKAAR